MKFLLKIPTVVLLFMSFTSSNAQIKNAKTESVKISGNCEMCKSHIESASNIKKVAQLDWNEESKTAKIIYDTSKTNQAEILKRVALAGYDNELFLAPNDAYAKLPGCCQYNRSIKTAMVQEKESTDLSMNIHKSSSEPKQDSKPLKSVFESYFSLKEAFVKSDQELVSSQAKALLASMNEVKMDKLFKDEHTVWMKIIHSLKSNTEKISTNTNLEKQRIAFMELSVSMYDLVKVSKHESPIFYQHCPMANDGKGANWLSKEDAVKNPYYGSKMLTCGKTVETIK